MVYLARSKSRRIVLEIDVETKKYLYLALEKNQVTLKDWFLENAESYIKKNFNPEFLKSFFVNKEV